MGGRGPGCREDRLVWVGHALVLDHGGSPQVLGKTHQDPQDVRLLLDIIQGLGWPGTDVAAPSTGWKLTEQVLVGTIVSDRKHKILG